MGLDFRGNNGRCPSFLVGGLLVMCLFLVCNWWSLSSQNLELLRQIDDLAEQLKINGDELDKCSRVKLELDERTKNLQDGAAQQRVRIDQMRASEAELQTKLQKDEDDLGETNKKLETSESALSICNIELESLKKVSQSKDKTLESLRTENKDLLKNMEDKDKKMKELESSLKKTHGGAGPNLVQMMRGKLAGEREKDAEGLAMGGNHDVAAALDENNAAEIKTDLDPVAPQDNNNNNEDPREEAMGQH